MTVAAPSVLTWAVVATPATSGPGATLTRNACVPLESVTS